ncbi:MAG: DUF1064 domain-containing protein [Nanoarchaeota archaeon]
MYYQNYFNKYGAKRTEWNGSTYASKFEASYAAELDLRQKGGDIIKWEKQKTLDLRVNGQHITSYKIDFIVHYPDGHREFVETKGFPTPDWIIKWRLLEATFEDFKENPDDCMLLVRQNSMKYFKNKKKGKK